MKPTVAPTKPSHYTAIVAEDEPLLTESLLRELARAWPELEVVAVVGDGQSAVDQALTLKPDVLFLDIQMPAMTGLEAAASLASSLPAPQAMPLLVFVTAFDQYAVSAFDKQAMDYILKPVRQERLLQTVQRLQARLAERHPISSSVFSAPTNASNHQFDATAALLLQLLLATTPKQPRLSLIQASRPSAHGSSISIVPIDEVVYFEAADKYIRVMTANTEYLIRTPIKDLLAQLDPDVFWQVHRGTVVKVSQIALVMRDDSFRVTLMLRGRSETLAVSRLYGHLFKAM
jgi:DNA-binding LytR/AlgR family response regulator